MAGITKEELSARRQRLLDELPNHGWDYVKAGMAAGYSRSYAQTRLKTYVTKDDKFCQRVSAKRAEIDAQTVDEREKTARVLQEIRDDPKAAARDRIQASIGLGKMCGWLSETRILETRDRQIELDRAQREFAQRVSLLLFDTTRLPDGSYAPDPPEIARKSDNP